MINKENEASYCENKHSEHERDHVDDNKPDHRRDHPHPRDIQSRELQNKENNRKERSEGKQVDTELGGVLDVFVHCFSFF